MNFEVMLLKHLAAGVLAAVTSLTSNSFVRQRIFTGVRLFVRLLLC